MATRTPRATNYRTPSPRVRRLLSKLNKVWREDDPDRKFVLFALSGTLIVVRRSDGLIVDEYPMVVCDGGDPYTVEDSETGNTYIEF